jgi:hypothetical protein
MRVAAVSLVQVMTWYLLLLVLQLRRLMLLLLLLLLQLPELLSPSGHAFIVTVTENRPQGKRLLSTTTHLMQIKCCKSSFHFTCATHQNTRRA